MPDPDGTVSLWPLVTAALLEPSGTKDRLRLFNRGDLAGEILVAQGDGAELLKRWGFKEVP